MAVETRPNNAAGRAWLAAEEAAGSYMLVNEKFISKLTGRGGGPALAHHHRNTS